MFFNRMFYFHFFFMISQEWFRTRLHGNLIEPLNSTRQLDYCSMQVVLNRVNSEIKRFILSSSISEQSESCSHIVQPEVRCESSGKWFISDFIPRKSSTFEFSHPMHCTPNLGIQDPTYNPPTQFSPFYLGIISPYF